MGISDIFAGVSEKTRSETDIYEGEILFYYMPGEGKKIPEKVSIGASFNGWNPSDEKYSLIKQTDGSFSRFLSLEAGMYGFTLIIDGKWIYNMKNYTLRNEIKPYPIQYKDDGFGGNFALIKIKKK
jgi:hypothetical protein